MNGKRLVSLVIMLLILLSGCGGQTATINERIDGMDDGPEEN